MGQENIELSPYVRGFESDSPESLGEKITILSLKIQH